MDSRLIVKMVIVAVVFASLIWLGVKLGSFAENQVNETSARIESAFSVLENN